MTKDKQQINNISKTLNNAKNLHKLIVEDIVENTVINICAVTDFIENIVNLKISYKHVENINIGFEFSCSIARGELTTKVIYNFIYDLYALNLDRLKLELEAN